MKWLKKIKKSHEQGKLYQGVTYGAMSSKYGENISVEENIAMQMFELMIRHTREVRTLSYVMIEAETHWQAPPHHYPELHSLAFKYAKIFGLLDQPSSFCFTKWKASKEPGTERYTWRLQPLILNSPVDLVPSHLDIFKQTIPPLGGIPSLTTYPHWSYGHILLTLMLPPPLHLVFAFPCTRNSFPKVFSNQSHHPSKTALKQVPS